MLKKTNLLYIIFIIFIIFIFYSFHFFLESDENKENNSLALEKIEKLNSINRKFDNILYQKLQYLNRNKIDKDIETFQKELKSLELLILKGEEKELLEASFKKVADNFTRKKHLLNKMEEHNHLLISSLQKLLKLQVYIQKRYYFSPIGLEVNSVIVNFTQLALGEQKKIRDIEKNIKRLVELKSLHKLVDDQLKKFIDNSYLAVKHLNLLKNINMITDETNLNNSIYQLRNSLLSYSKNTNENKTFALNLLFTIIICLILLLIVLKNSKKIIPNNFEND